MQQTTIMTLPEGFAFQHLTMTRGAMLQYLTSCQIAPEELLQLARNYATVTHWEELLCTAIDPEAGRLMALVGIHRAKGYSGPLRRHGSIEYVRFFIDWEDGRGHRPVGLAHFKVCDRPQDSLDPERTRYWRVSIDFDRERYWGCVMNGQQPKVKAVLSWNYVPKLEHGFTPLFGNALESVVRIDSDEALLQLARCGLQEAQSAASEQAIHPLEIYSSTLQ